jgi:flagellar biosynthesis protein FlhB
VSDDQGEKSEEATQQRREDFRKRGQVAQTKELSAVFLLFTSLLMIWMLGKFFLTELHELFEVMLGQGVPTVHAHADWIPFASYAAYKAIYLFAPVAGVMFLISFASTVVQF